VRQRSSQCPRSSSLALPLPGLPLLLSDKAKTTGQNKNGLLSQSWYLHSILERSNVHPSPVPLASLFFLLLIPGPNWVCQDLIFCFILFPSRFSSPSQLRTPCFCPIIYTHFMELGFSVSAVWMGGILVLQFDAASVHTHCLDMCVALLRP